MLRPATKIINQLYKQYFCEPQLKDFIDLERHKPVYLLDKVETASSEAIYRWDRLSSVGFYWKWDGKKLNNSVARFKEFDNLVTKEHQDLITIDLNQVTLLSASKGDLRNAESLAQFSERETPKNIPSWLDDVSESQLISMMSHSEIRIANSISVPGFISDTLELYSWHEGYALINNGGSHHLAAAKYIANKLSKQVKLSGSCDSYSISNLSVSLLNSTIDVYLVPKHDSVYSGIIRFAKAAQTDFGFISTNEVANLLGDLVVLPKSSAISAQFEQCGFMHVGKYLNQITQA